MQVTFFITYTANGRHHGILGGELSGPMLMRNHPNGNAEPSEHGKALAQVIVPAAGTIGLWMLDRQIEAPKNDFCRGKAGML